MLRVFGFAAGLVLLAVVADVVVVPVFAGTDTPAFVVVVVPAGTGAADVVGVVAGSSVSGAGTAGKGLESTLAIISFRPASELL